ncbi:MAG: hypothetical protein P4L59_07005 [Desulfosporosinus sp.]|nr:hypothetical protein [Desulfosporosinus sp.]
MSPVDFEELPFTDRPDLTPYLIHLTKNTKSDDGFSAFDNLVSLLKTKKIWGSDSRGFVKGPNKAACFMDVPFISLKYILNKDNCNPENPRYEPFGVFVTKKYGYGHGLRPVLYLSNEELKDLGIPEQELWRVVRFEVAGEKWISWLHEREWRSKGDFILPNNAGVLVETIKQARELQKLINENPEDFKVTPRTIIPLSVICQGLNL